MPKSDIEGELDTPTDQKVMLEIDNEVIKLLCLLQHEKAATFLDILKSFFRPTLVRV